MDFGVMISEFSKINFNDRNVLNDVSYLIMCFEKQEIYINFDVFQVPLDCRSYEDVMDTMKLHFPYVYQYEFLEIMPLIDHYLAGE